ncbi:MAG: CbiX/SirB N-terminal domain-containing protein, partial [Tumebacillaceae bacterium]
MGEETRGILLVAHGSEIAGAERDVERVAAALRRMTGQSVEIGFLSFTAPDLSEAVLRCAESGIAQWVV